MDTRTHKCLNCEKVTSFVLEAQTSNKLKRPNGQVYAVINDTLARCRLCGIQTSIKIEEKLVQ